MWFKTLTLLVVATACMAEVTDKDIYQAKTMQELLAIAEKEQARTEEQIVKAQEEQRKHVATMAQAEQDLIASVERGPERCKTNLDTIKASVEERKAFYATAMARDVVGALKSRADVQAIFRNVAKNLEEVKGYVAKGTGSVKAVIEKLIIARIQLTTAIAVDLLNFVKDAAAGNDLIKFSLEFTKCKIFG